MCSAESKNRGGGGPITLECVKIMTLLNSFEDVKANFAAAKLDSAFCA